MNLPNKLTITRMILVPVCMFFIVFSLIPDTWGRIISAAIFILTSLTDMLDGMIARKRNMITDFGKFLDPVADKLLIIGSLLAILVKYREDALFSNILLWVLFVIIMREIGVTALRMVVASQVVVAAAWPGKLKTVSQMLCVLVILLEPVVVPNSHNIGSYIMLVVAGLFTVVSGWLYFKQYWPLINPKK